MMLNNKNVTIIFKLSKIYINLLQQSLIFSAKTSKLLKMNWSKQKLLPKLRKRKEKKLKKKKREKLKKK